MCAIIASYEPFFCNTHEMLGLNNFLNQLWKLSWWLTIMLKMN